MSLRVISLVAGLLLLVAAPTAGADQTKLAEGKVVAGPVLAGDAVVYVVRSAGGEAELRRVSQGGTSRLIARLGHGEGELSLAASPRAVAVTTVPSAGRVAKLLAGPAGGPLKQVARGCAAERFGGFRGGVALSGTRLAYVDVPCSGQRQSQVIVRDLAGGGESRISAASQPPVDIAGDFVAYYSSSNSNLVLVYSLASRRVAYGVGNGDLEDWDLQDDGTLALTRLAPSSGDDVFWSSWGDQSEHYIHGCSESTVAIDGGRVVCQNSGYQGSDLVVRDLLDRPVAEVPLGGELAGGVDLRGDLLTYATAGCSGGTPEIWLVDVRRPAGPRPNCNGRIRSSRTRLDRAGRVGIWVSCREACSGRLRLTSPGGGHAYGARRFRLESNQIELIRLELRGVSKLLRRRSSATLRAELSLSAPSGTARTVSRLVTVTR